MLPLKSNAAKALLVCDLHCTRRGFGDERARVRRRLRESDLPASPKKRREAYGDPEEMALPIAVE
jgi:hypothetical protein